MSGKNPFYGATFAERKAIREGKQSPTVKQVDEDALEVEDKAVRPSETKSRPARKKS